jgi:hypothetical protein
MLRGHTEEREKRRLEDRERQFGAARPGNGVEVSQKRGLELFLGVRAQFAPEEPA